jgi:hypothetical protein
LPESALEHEEAAREFARQAGFGLAGLVPGDLTRGNLTLLFALSAWLRIGGIGTVGACSVLLGLRRALLEVSGLDKVSEPVPLVAGDPHCALVSLSIYLHGLISRSAAHVHEPMATVVEEALDLLP